MMNVRAYRSMARGSEKCVIQSVAKHIKYFGNAHRCLIQHAGTPKVNLFKSLHFCWCCVLVMLVGVAKGSEACVIASIVNT